MTSSMQVQPPPLLLHRLLMVTGQAELPPQRGWNIVLSSEGPVLTAEAACPVRLSGLFDIFPESYWSRFTMLQRVNLRCRGCGAIIVRLIRRRCDGSGEICLAQATIEGARGEVVLSTDLVDRHAPDSYLFLEAIAVTPGSCLTFAAWETKQPQPHRPRLGIVITTYNREHFLVTNLSRLHGRWAGGQVIVVNHGAPGLADRLAGRLAPDRAIRWIDQENSGGAGGFTRGMVEHRAAGDLTHVLLMDDDIDLPEDLVERLTVILSFAHPKFCVGGAMLDYYQRNRLFSAGDTLLPKSFGIGHITPPEGCNIAEPTGVDFVARVNRPDFNGWWCFAFPIDALDKVGLPMPCFIRGDDVEFGYRLMRAGMPTLVWPGLAVWHVPFAGKSAPWHMFYDRRNSLFANAHHRRISRMAALGKLIGGFMHHLLRYDYDRVCAMTMGIAAFNAGAAGMARWNHRDHHALIVSTSIMDALPDYDIESLSGGALELDSRRLAGVRRSLQMAVRFLLDLTWPWRALTPHQLPVDEIWRPDFTSRPALVIERSPDGQSVRLYRHDWRKSWRATVGFVRAVAGMLLCFHQELSLPSLSDFPPSGRSSASFPANNMFPVD